MKWNAILHVVAIPIAVVLPCTSGQVCLPTCAVIVPAHPLVLNLPALGRLVCSPRRKAVRLAPGAVSAKTGRESIRSITPATGHTRTGRGFSRQFLEPDLHPLGYPPHHAYVRLLPAHRSCLRHDLFTLQRPCIMVPVSLLTRTLAPEAQGSACTRGQGHTRLYCRVDTLQREGGNWLGLWTQPRVDASMAAFTGPSHWRGALKP